MALFADVSGDQSSGAPLVLIHGFGGSAAAWDAVRTHLSAETPVIAYDLPGHRRSVGAEGRGGAGRMAKAIVTDLDSRGVSAFHLAGHSMGGAVAALIAMRVPDKAKSLTLFAPGGMGAEIDANGLKAFAEAKEEATLRAALQKMVADTFVVPDEMVGNLAEERAIPGVMDAIGEVYASMFAVPGGLEQGAIPREMLAGLTMPARVYWGDGDPTLPFRQMKQMPENFEKHPLYGMGHMLLDECPDLVADALKEAIG